MYLCRLTFLVCVALLAGSIQTKSILKDEPQKLRESDFVEFDRSQEQNKMKTEHVQAPVADERDAFWSTLFTALTGQPDMAANLTDDSPITVNTISIIEMDDPLMKDLGNEETMVEMMSLPNFIKSLEQLYQAATKANETTTQGGEESKRLVKRQSGTSKLQGINPRNMPKYILKNKLGVSMLAAAFGMPKHKKGAHVGNSNPFHRHHKREAVDEYTSEDSLMSLISSLMELRNQNKNGEASVRKLSATSDFMPISSIVGSGQNWGTNSLPSINDQDQMQAQSNLQSFQSAPSSSLTQGQLQRNNVATVSSQSAQPQAMMSSNFQSFQAAPAATSQGQWQQNSIPTVAAQPQASSFKSAPASQGQWQQNSIPIVASQPATFTSQKIASAPAPIRIQQNIPSLKTSAQPIRTQTVQAQPQQFITQDVVAPQQSYQSYQSTQQYQEIAQPIQEVAQPIQEAVQPVRTSVLTPSITATIETFNDAATSPLNVFQNLPASQLQELLQNLLDSLKNNNNLRLSADDSSNQFNNQALVQQSTYQGSYDAQSNQQAISNQQQTDVDGLIQNTHANVEVISQDSEQGPIVSSTYSFDIPLSDETIIRVPPGTKVINGLNSGTPNPIVVNGPQSNDQLNAPLIVSIIPRRVIDQAQSFVSTDDQQQQSQDQFIPDQSATTTTSTGTSESLLDFFRSFENYLVQKQSSLIQQPVAQTRTIISPPTASFANRAMGASAYQNAYGSRLGLRPLSATTGNVVMTSYGMPDTTSYQAPSYSAVTVSQPIENSYQAPSYGAVSQPIDNSYQTPSYGAVSQPITSSYGTSYGSASQPIDTTFTAEAPIEETVDMLTENYCQIGKSEPIYEGTKITEAYCRCPDGNYGLSCQENFVNPCLGHIDNEVQFYSADAIFQNKYFIHCDAQVPILKKCPGALYWNDDLKACDYDNNFYSYASYPATVQEEAPINSYSQSYSAPAPSYSAPAPTYSAPVQQTVSSYSAPAPSYSAPAPVQQAVSSYSAPSYSAPAPVQQVVSSYSAPSYSSVIPSLSNTLTSYASTPVKTIQPQSSYSSPTYSSLPQLFKSVGY